MLVVWRTGGMLFPYCQCVEVWTRLHGKLAYTQVKCTWLLPTYVKEISYVCVEDINFKSARKLKEDLDASIENIGEGLCYSTLKAAAPPKPKPKAVKGLSPPSVNEMNDFYKSLNYCEIKPIALSLCRVFYTEKQGHTNCF